MKEQDRWVRGVKRGSHASSAVYSLSNLDYVMVFLDIYSRNSIKPRYISHNS
jgi:hypothetical protein